MIAGLPWTAWLLIAAAILPALVLALAFFFAHRDAEDSDTTSNRRRTL